MWKSRRFNHDEVIYWKRRGAAVVLDDLCVFINSESDVLTIAEMLETSIKVQSGMIQYRFLNEEES